jgi:hypothetical protein
MVSIHSYSREYIMACRTALAKQVGAFQAFAAAGARDAAISATLAAFEPLYFNGLLLVLHGYFVDRARTLEKKDGNVLNEVRMLATSLMENDGVLAEDSAIRYVAQSAVLQLDIGERIALDKAGFTRLAPAFLREIESRYR